MAVKLIAFSVVGNAVALTALFLSAGTFAYWQGWLFLAVAGLCSWATFLYLWKSDRELLKRRMRGPMEEERGTQKVIASALYLCLLCSVVLSALDYRFGWTGNVPLLALAGDLLFAVGMYLYFLVYRANRFAAATVEIAADQRVISSGPYAIVRHPMYVALLIVAFAVPLALGSTRGLLFLVPIVAVVVWRLLDEETFLEKHLPGYSEYQRQTRWRLVPGVF